ncbi:hypothetical protein AB1E18_019656 [Capra hircus]
MLQSLPVPVGGGDRTTCCSPALGSSQIKLEEASHRNTLMEIVERLENHPQEVVILVCRNFDGMMEDLHKYLMGCIKNISGDMCPCKVEPEAILGLIDRACVELGITKAASQLHSVTL